MTMKGRSGDLARETVVKVTCDFCGALGAVAVEVRVDGGQRVAVDICSDDRRDRTLDEIVARGRPVVASPAKRSATLRALDARIRA
jgi:hypothetical protein